MPTTASFSPQSVGYSVVGCSSHSGSYRPEHIMVDKPTDPTSRWSGMPQTSNASMKLKQWVLLKLQTLAVVKSITFGKYYKAHPCNLKEFKVFAGLSSNSMTEILHAGLKNDPTPETFSVKYRNSEGVPFPSQYIKIVPISAHAQSYNTSIWFVSLTGIIEEQFVKLVKAQYSHYKEAHALRILCKHLRSRGLPYQNLLEQTGILLEHPTITKVYESLVLGGDCEEAEHLMEAAADQYNILRTYIASCDPKAFWRKICDSAAGGLSPQPRSGHQMCIDSARGLIYLLGGWNGSQNLGDFWVYSIREDRWKELSGNTERDGGPSARSCHQMAFDPHSECIYIIGRFYDGKGVEASAPPQTQNGDQPDLSKECLNDFWKYSTTGPDAGSWSLLSSNTAADGGPSLIYDHSMVVDADYRLLVVFGGTVVTPETISQPEPARYSGLYFFNLQTSKWSLIFQDPSPTSSVGQSYIPSRTGHSMVLDSQKRLLYIFAGQRLDSSRGGLLSDMWTFSLVTHEVNEICGNYSVVGGPQAAFTQSVVVDNDLREFYVMAGLTKSAMDATDVVRSTLWIYRIENQQWVKVSSLPGSLEDSESPNQREAYPRPRFAHQTVYEANGKQIFVFGGNSGKDDELRLSDFWCATLKRPSRDDILRKVKLILRRQRFIEMCNSGLQIEALQYLQTEVSAVVDHSDQGEGEDFRSLLTHLVSRPPETNTLADLSTGRNPADSTVLDKMDSPEVSTDPLPETKTLPEEDLNLPTEATTPKTRDVTDLRSPETTTTELPSTVSQSPSHTAEYPPSPDPEAPIAQASGSSFPPPPSPQTDDDVEMAPSGHTTGSTQRRGSGLYTATQIRNTMRRLSEMTAVPQAMQPPPAPQLQHQTLPIVQRLGNQLPLRYPALSPAISSSATALSTTNTIPGFARAQSAPSIPSVQKTTEKEFILHHPQVPPQLFQQRMDAFNSLMEYVSPEAREPKENLLELVQDSELE